MATLPLRFQSATPRLHRRLAPKRQHRAADNALLRRLYDGIIVARQMQAEREIARYLEMTGGKLTDSVEREIERRFISDRFKVNALPARAHRPVADRRS